MNRKIKIGKYMFDGPMNFPKNLENISGVYVILCPIGSRHKILYVGEGEVMRRDILSNKTIKCWKNTCNGYPKFAGLYCNKRDRVRVAAELRAEFAPPCGG